MISVKVTGLEQLTANTAAMAKQLPFAVSKALNETGKILQKKVIEELLPADFILSGRQRPARGAPWWKPKTALGFNLQFSKKSQGENMQTVLGSRANWLALHETGGVKRLKSRVAVPYGARKSKFDIVSRARKPRRVLARKAFILPTKDGTEGIFERTGPNDGELRLLYLLQPSTDIKADLHFEKFTTAEAQKIIGPIFEREFAKAITSAKPSK
jgi:hypothetical protein